MKEYVLTTKGKEYPVVASSREEAFGKFFLSVKNGDIPISDLAHIVTLHSEEGEYPIATVPVVFLLGKLRFEDAVHNISSLLDVSLEAARNTLMYTLENVRWVIREVEKLEGSRDDEACRKKL